MSADNWTVCPKCKVAAEAACVKSQKEIAEAYGKVSAEEYLKLVQAAPKLPESRESLREDYELGILRGLRTWNPQRRVFGELQRVLQSLQFFVFVRSQAKSMKYQIIVTDGKILVRQRRFFTDEYLRSATGEVQKFDSEQDAINYILARTNCQYCYEGAIIREIKTEDYHYD